MKKTVFMAISVLMVFFPLLGACDNDDSVTDAITDITITGIGISNNAVTKYMDSGLSFSLGVDVSVSGNISKDVTWDSGNKTVALVSNNGTVTLLSEGDTDIDAVSVADPSKKATLRLTVVDDRPVPPGYPAGEYVIPLDEDARYYPSTTLEAGAILFHSKSGNMSTIEYNSLAAKSNWQNYIKISISSGSYANSTHIGINILCRPAAVVFVKLVNSQGKKIWEGDVAGNVSSWTTHSIPMSFVERAGLAGLNEMYIYAPKPETSTSTGEVKIHGIWLDGQDTPAVIPVFTYDNDKIIDSINLIPTSLGITQSGPVPGTDGKLTITFSSGGFLVSNTGFNDWRSVSYNLPKTVDYSDARWLVFDITEISGRGLLKFKILEEGLREIYPVVGTQYYASYYSEGELTKFFTDNTLSSVYLQIAPSYLDTGSQAGFKLNGIYISE
jgi:hypothetical protein